MHVRLNTREPYRLDQPLQGTFLFEAASGCSYLQLQRLQCARVLFLLQLAFSCSNQPTSCNSPQERLLDGVWDLNSEARPSQQCLQLDIQSQPGVRGRSGPQTCTWSPPCKRLSHHMSKKSHQPHEHTFPSMAKDSSWIEAGHKATKKVEVLPSPHPFAITSSKLQAHPVQACHLV